MKPCLVFQTDFTYKESAVAAMYGVVMSVDPELRVFDLTHEIPQYDIWSASFRLFQPLKFWPEGTIFVSVVDPGVGTPRKPCVARTANDYLIVTPDNGTLTHVEKKFGIVAVREIDTTVNRLRGKDTENTNVFHGRDVFSYCAAKLASGQISFDQVGPAYPVNEIVRFPTHEPEVQGNAIHGIFEIGDPNFGNVWTNIPRQLMEETGFDLGQSLRLVVEHDGKTVLDRELPYHSSFGYVAKGEPLLYVNELNHVAAAISQGNFCEKFGIRYGPDWKVVLTTV